MIKASGGIRDFETAEKYVILGVDRIGTSSGIIIVEGENAQNKKPSTGKGSK